MRVESGDGSFDVVRRGYDRAQVDERLSTMAAELQGAVAGRDAATARQAHLGAELTAARDEIGRLQAERDALRGETDRLVAQVAELSIIPETVDGMSARLQRMVETAHEEIHEMRARATASAAQVLTLAQDEADELHARSERERRRVSDELGVMQQELGAALADGRSRLEQVRTECDERRARLRAELADSRAEAERALREELDEQRRALAAELAGQQERHRAEAAHIVEAASEHARAQQAEVAVEVERVRAAARADVEAAQHHLGRLRELHHHVAEQLTAVRALLEWTLPQMGAAVTRAAALPPAPVPELITSDEKAAG